VRAVLSGGAVRVVRSLAAVALAGGLVLVPGAHGAGAKAPTRARPDATLTPGATDAAVTQDNVQQTICVSGYAKTVRHVSSRTKGKVFAEYHVSKSKRSKYVIDHLIALELGGSNDIKNLWPELKKGDQGSRTKDRTEDSLHSYVCNGTTSLAAAQLAIVADWTTAPTTVTTTTTTLPPPPPTTTLPPPPPTTAAPAPPPAPACPNGSYTNVNGQVVCSPYPSPGGPPPGATAICNDGTYSFSQNRQGTCSSHGGVRQFL
jgi:hypothetical protein